MDYRKLYLESARDPLGGVQFLEYLNSMQEAGVGLSVIGNRGIYKIPSAINHPGTWRTILKKPRQMKLFKEEGKRASSKVKQVAYLTGMKQGEILGLTWGQVDLREGFIRLQPGDTKTNEGRLVPFNGELREMFMALSRNLPAAKVFSRNGKPIASIREAFEAACRRAGIEEFTFHDLRHTAINNWRLRGHDYFRIMAATGHKTLNVFKRYNTVSKDELKALVGENQ